MCALDGQRYGPADVETLRSWAAEGRLDANMVLEEEGTGRKISAGSILGQAMTVPPTVTANPIGAQYPRAGIVAGPQRVGRSEFAGRAMTSACLALFLAFYQGYSIISLPFAWFYSVQAVRNDRNTLSWVALSVTILATIIMIIRLAARAVVG